MELAIDRRQYKRFDSFMVVEFKPARRPLDTLLGITRNFSYGGFSFESQDFDLEPGENLEFTFKNHDKQLTVSDVGQIVWKRKPNEFNCYAGISFEDIKDENKRKVMEMVAESENIDINEYIPADTRAEKVPSITEWTAGALINSIKESFTRSYRSSRRKKKSYVPALIGCLVALIIASIIFDLISREEETHPVSPPVKIQPPVTIKKELPPVEKAVERPFTIIDKPSLNKAMPMKIPDNSLFYIQVGAWKNPVFANDTLNKLINIYPKAHLVEENGFHKLRIPGINSRDEGQMIVKDIKDRFNFQALLVRKK